MSESNKPADLLDLKMMPSWVNEPAQAKDYSNYQGEDESRSFDRGGGGGRGPQRGRDSRPPRSAPRRDSREPRPGGQGKGPRRPDSRRPEGRDRRDEQRPPREAPPPLPQVDVRFIPHAPAFESVIAQIKSGSVTYSVFALARLFLDKPERYDVRLKAAEGAVLHQLGEHGAVATDPRTLEGSAFAQAKDEFYEVEQTQTEPLKGNFTNVARCRLSGTLLGPTNHHAYQPQLRNLYEQRFSRRMSFPDYQRQIEIVSDPAVVEEWKEQARSITTYKTKGVEPEVAFKSAADAERHFRQTHLPTLLRSAPELTISGVISRRLGDRGLGRVIEDAWSAETRSPSKMMQELSAGLRTAGLNIFRHRKGMLFVAPFRIRTFGHERSGVSPSINGILEKLAEAPGMSRKQLAEKIAPAELEVADAERAKRALASDLHWLIHEGYVIEFNDGTLDLPRPKQPAAPPPEAKRGKAEASSVQAATGEGEETKPSEGASVAPCETAEEGGMTVEQSIEPVTTAEPVPEAQLTSEPAEASPVDEEPAQAESEAEQPAEEVSAVGDDESKKDS